MTRKQALLKTIELIGQNKTISSRQRKELIDKLVEIASELPLTGWSERSIHDTIQQWAIENGRNPTCSDLKRKGLPPHPVIEHHFKMTSKEFLENYYPRPQYLCNSKTFGDRTKEQWLDLFRKEYERIKPSSAARYNICRSAGTPTWATVARLFGCKRWLKLLQLAGLGRYPALSGKKDTRVINVQSYFNQKTSFDSFHTIQQLLSSRKAE